LTLEEIKQWLEENKEEKDVQAYLGELSAVSNEKVEGFLDTVEGKKLLQPRLDRNFSTGLNTWKEKNLPKLIDDGVKEANPSETPEQKRIRELEDKIANAEKESTHEKLLNTAVTQASEKGLPTDIVSFFVGEDEETTLTNLGTFEEKYNTALQAAVDKKFKEGGRDVDSGGKDDKSAGAGFAKSANGDKKAPKVDIWN
jgi:rubrerythrin